MRTLQRSLLLLALALLIVIPRNIFSCGPFFEEATFSFNEHPDFPLKDYLGGKLGVLKPGYYRMFLVVAYRNLSNKPFTPAEIAALDPLLTHEARYADEIGDYGFEEAEQPTTPPPPLPAQTWLAERAKALGETPKHDANLDQDLNWGNYQSFLNCPDTAFTNAVQTLHDRQQKWGATSADVKEWIAGQDVVFSHCSKRQDAMPSAITTSNKLLQQDRDYQIAAALFYSGVPDQLVQAQQRFDAIGQDKTSPWHTWGPYLAARSLIRAATLKSTDDKKFDQSLMADAEARLKTISATRDLATTRLASEHMLGFVETRLHPDARMHELARNLANGSSADVRQDFIDYRYLLDNGSAEPNAEARKDDLTDWIRTFQAAGEKDHAIAKWRETKSLPWLLAAINVVDAKDAAAQDLLAAAAKVDARDPRLLTVFYRRVALLRAMNNDKDARSLIDANLTYLGKDAPISSRNLFWEQRTALATSFDDFLRFAPREDASQHHAQANLKPDAPVPPNTPNDVYFDTDATAVLNRSLPDTLLVQAANNAQLPKALQAEIAESTFVRALLLNQPSIAAKLAPAVKQSTPVLISSIVNYAKATTDDDRHRAVLFALLHNPGMRPYVVPNMQRTTEIEKIDSFHDNWWCEDVGAQTEVKPLDYADGAAQAGKPATRPAPNSSWLNAADKSAGTTEWETLSKLGAAPSYLGREVIAWAKAAPDDPRIPEALHLVVRATRYGCGDDKTSSYSKQAFQLLHAKYPKSEWTKKTPYFY